MNFNLKKVEKHTHPFPYAIIENPFEEAENIERDFPSMDNVKSSLRMGQGHNISFRNLSQFTFRKRSVC